MQSAQAYTWTGLLVRMANAITSAFFLSKRISEPAFCWVLGCSQTTAFRKGPWRATALKPTINHYKAWHDQQSGIVTWTLLSILLHLFVFTSSRAPHQHSNKLPYVISASFFHFTGPWGLPFLDLLDNTFMSSHTERTLPQSVINGAWNSWLEVSTRWTTKIIEEF